MTIETVICNISKLLLSVLDVVFNMQKEYISVNLKDIVSSISGMW